MRPEGEQILPVFFLRKHPRLSVILQSIEKYGANPGLMVQ